jgi:hypothetical protein
MAWFERLAKVTWSLLLLLAWAIEVLLILKLFPPSYVRELVLPVFPSIRFFAFYGSFAVAYMAALFLLLVLLAFAWSLALRPVVAPQRQLAIVQGKLPAQAAMRRLGEFVVNVLHRST